MQFAVSALMPLRPYSALHGISLEYFRVENKEKAPYLYPRLINGKMTGSETLVIATGISMTTAFAAGTVLYPKSSSAGTTAIVTMR